MKKIIILLFIIFNSFNAFAYDNWRKADGCSASYKTKEICEQKENAQCFKYGNKICEYHKMDNGNVVLDQVKKDAYDQAKQLKDADIAAKKGRIKDAKRDWETMGVAEKIELIKDLL